MLAYVSLIIQTTTMTLANIQPRLYKSALGLVKLHSWHSRQKMSAVLLSCYRLKKIDNIFTFHTQIIGY